MEGQNSLSSDFPTKPSPLNSARIFPDIDHRWLMGLRPGNAADFFMNRDPTGSACAERAQLLVSNPGIYSVLTADAVPALNDTVKLAQSFGISIDESLAPMEQLFALGRAWESDFVWMHATSKNIHRLIGGIVCFPSSWSVDEKLGRTMHEIHEPVPGLNASLAQKIETFLFTLAPNVAWEREIVGYTRDTLLNHHPSIARRPLDETVTIDEVWIRLEHQLLMKLPESGSILFGIRVALHPLTQLVDDSRAVTGLLRTLSTMSADAADYKGVTAARSRIIELIQNSIAVKKAH